MEDELYLGRILRNEINWARIEPLAVKRSGRWVDIENTLETFPTEGKVFSKRGLHNAPANSLWTFVKRPNERRESNGADLLLADGLVKATPIVDLSSLSVEQARQRLFSQGLDLLIDGNSAAVIALLSNDTFCEINLSRSEDGMWRANVPVRTVLLREAPEEWYFLSSFEGLRVMPSQSIPQTPIIETVNWCSDQDFVERVIERFRKFTQHVGDTPYARPSKESVKYIARALQQAELLPGDENDVELNLERLEAQWPVLEARFEASEKLTTLIVGLKTSREKINAAVEQATEQAMELARPELERRVREDTERALTKTVSLRNDIAKEVDALAQRRVLAEQELVDLETLCAQGREERQGLAQNLRIVADALRTGLAASPRQDRAAMTFMAERIEGVLEQSGYRGHPLVPSTLPPWGLPSVEKASLEIQFDGLSSRLVNEAKLHAVEEKALSLIDVFCRSGELVLLCGPQAELALRAYARCVTGGAYRTIACDPSIIGLDDLWRAPGTQAPTVFAHAWHAAECEPEALHLLCMRDIDSSPFRLWLTSLQAVLSAKSRPKNLLIVATTTAREEMESSISSNVDCRDYLVPIFPNVHESGSASVFGMAIPPVPPPSRVRLNPNDVPDELVVNKWLRRLISLESQKPKVLARLATFKDSFTGTTDDALVDTLYGWGQYLHSGDQANLARCIKDGCTALAQLQHHH